MSAHAIFVPFTPKLRKLATQSAKLWGKLEPLNHSTEKVTAASDTETDRMISAASIARTPSYHLPLVKDSSGDAVKASAIYVDLDDYQ